MKLYNGDCLEVMKDIADNSIDMTLTSPPYDDLRNYENTLNWDFNIFMEVANQLYTITKNGGVVIWVVGDKTKNGSESLNSFKQAIYFKDIGFNVYDTMIYKKLNYAPLSHRRYEQEFEYIFCFSKGKPKTFNPIMIPCKWAGTETWGKTSFYKDDTDQTTPKGKLKIKDFKIRGNIFEYRTGKTKTGNIKHPAMFSEDLAKDMIISWSNENDVVLDPFMGSGTSGVVAKEINRNFIGIEIVDEYYKIAKERIYD